MPLPPSTALPKLFPHLSVHADAELCRGYFPRFPRLSTLQSLPCRSLPPKAISHGFPSVHHVVAEVSLPPTGAAVSTLSSLPCPLLPTELPKLLPTASRPSTLSLLKHRSLPTELSPSYFPRFPVHPVIAEASLPPNGALHKLFPTVSRPSTLSSLKCRSLPTELSPSYFPRFPVHPVVAEVSLPPQQSKLTRSKS